jgi:succinoglycan biosynthesis protein ExoL
MRSGGFLKIVYFVHDVHDAAVERRVRMFNASGASTTVLGFRRRDRTLAQLHGAPVIDLGKTEDGRMAQRVSAVFANLLRSQVLLEAAKGADIIIGRNVEAFGLAARARAASPQARLVYECLDIHRLLLGSSLPAKAVQAVQARLLKNADLVLTSSPAFEREYFRKRLPCLPPVYLIENKLLLLDGAASHAAADLPASADTGPPWTIGWFGMLRCKRTFDLLADLVRQSEGRINVLIAGRPSPAEFTDFPAMVAKVPGFTFHGAYAAADLPQLYARCHFAWAIDFFEEGLNSSWLLPNRIYEALAHGVVPIALSSVEVGRWLAARSVGLVLPDAAVSLQQAFSAMDMQHFRQLRAQVDEVPKSDVIATKADCDALLAAMIGQEQQA